MIRIFKKNRFGLYLDSLYRFSLAQIYYLFVNRILKKIFPAISFSVAKKSSKKFVDIRENYVSLLKNNLTKIFDSPNCLGPIWEIDPDQKNKLEEKNSKYFCSLQKHFDRILSDGNIHQITNVWLNKGTEKEEENNYQRFYLFDEILKENSNKLELTFKLIDQWIDLHPPAFNKAWDCFNCAIRLINWIKLFYYVPKKIFPNAECWSKILNSINFQANYIYNNIEYDINGNHVLFELVSLWLISIIFPELENSNTWLAFTEKKITKEINIQFYECGFHYEHSLHYHIQATLICLIWLHGIKSISRFTAKSIQKKIYNSCNLIDDFILPDDSVPQLGDCCYTFLHRNLRQDIANINKLGKLFFQDNSSFKSNHDNYKKPTQYFIHDIETSKLIVDIGNVGLLSNAGHGHSDLLNFIYSSQNKTLFIDPGTKSYNNDSKSLQYKKAGYHNTVSIDNHDQAMLWGYFRWAYLPEDLFYIVKKRSDKILILQGEYFGFRNIGGFRHRRSFIMKLNYLQINDYITGRGCHDIALNFILAPDVEVILKKDHAILSTESNQWKFRWFSCFKSVASTNKIHIYKEYGVHPIPSTRLKIMFNNASLKFQCSVKLFPLLNQT